MLAALTLWTCGALNGSTEPTTLAHIFRKGERSQYAVQSHLQVETRPRGLDTWIPEDLDLSYKFTTEVTDLLPDGVAKLHYQRPTFTQVSGETYDSPARTKVDRHGVDLDLTVSIANEIVSHSDHLQRTSKWIHYDGGAQGELGAFMEDFVDDLYRLAAYTGSMDNALDFAPKLPFGKVSVGDTWKRTVCYQPQKLAGKGEKMAVQRLDYAYTYLGALDSEGRKVLRIHGTLALDSDLAAFANQSSQSESKLKELPVKMNAEVDFDLDPSTCRTIAANARTEGSFKVVLSDDPDRPVRYVKLKGRTSMHLIGIAPGPRP